MSSLLRNINFIRSTT